MHLEPTDVLTAPRSDKSESRSEARVERVLAEYLRIWGLRDPSTIAAHCRLWVRQVPDGPEAGSTDADLLPNQLARLAVHEAMLDIDQWLNHITLLASKNAADAPWRRGLVAIELQSVIDDYPEALLQYEHLPKGMLERLGRAARPVVPTPQPTYMHSQPLGELASALQPRWWRRLFGDMAAGMSSALRLRWGS